MLRLRFRRQFLFFNVFRNDQKSTVVPRLTHRLLRVTDFAQVIVLIKANGVEGGYGAVREACSNLEEFMDDEGDKARWREIFSIPAKA